MGRRVGVTPTLSIRAPSNGSPDTGLLPVEPLGQAPLTMLWSSVLLARTWAMLGAEMSAVLPQKITLVNVGLLLPAPPTQL